MGTGNYVDVEVAVDYATMDGFLRLHVDLPVQLDDLYRVRALMDEEQWDAARSELKRVCPPTTSEIIDLFFDRLKIKRGA